MGCIAEELMRLPATCGFREWSYDRMGLKGLIKLSKGQHYRGSSWVRFKLITVSMEAMVTSEPGLVFRWWDFELAFESSLDEWKSTWLNSFTLVNSSSQTRLPFSNDEWWNFSFIVFYINWHFEPLSTKNYNNRFGFCKDSHGPVRNHPTNVRYFRGEQLSHILCKNVALYPICRLFRFFLFVGDPIRIDRLPPTTCCANQTSQARRRLCDESDSTEKSLHVEQTSKSTYKRPCGPLNFLFPFSEENEDPLQKNSEAFTVERLITLIVAH